MCDQVVKGWIWLCVLDIVYCLLKMQILFSWTSPKSDDPKCTDLVVPYLEVVAYKIWMTGVSSE